MCESHLSHYKLIHWHSDALLWLMHVLVSMSQSLLTSQEQISILLQPGEVKGCIQSAFPKRT